MKKISIILTVVLLIPLLAVPGLAAADYKPDSIYGAKAQGMGGAFTAIANDASAIYWNPAGLAQNSLIGLQASTGGEFKPKQFKDILTFIGDLKDVQKADTLPKKAEQLNKLNYPEETSFSMNGLVSANLSKLGVGVIVNNTPKIGEISTVSVPDTDKEVKEVTVSNTIVGQGMAGIGLNLLDPPIVGKVSVGATGKMFYARKDEAKVTSEKLSGGEDLVQSETSSPGFGANVGALVTLSDIDILNVKAGASVRNAFTTGIKGEKLLENSSLTERTTTLGAGVTFKFPLINILSARVAADLEMPETGQNIQHIGAEGTLGLFSLRAGAYSPNLTTEENRALTAGFGFNVPFLDFNLAVDHLTASSQRSVNFSGTFNF